MPITPGQAEFQRAFQVSPIILTGGIAAAWPGGMLAIIQLTQPEAFATALSPGAEFNLDDAFAQFLPLPGATLVDNDIGTYPFANQQTAANAIITKPLAISLMMVCPVRDLAGYWLKFSIMGNLQQALYQHNLLGGLYSIATPSMLYSDCVMTAMRDISSGESRQPQIQWQLDFIKPLVTQQDAAQAQNTLMSKISSGTQLTPNSNGETPWSGQAPAVGNSTSGVAPSVAPSAQPPAATSTGYGAGDAAVAAPSAPAASGSNLPVVPFGM